jgi:hypothetical protein
MGEMTPLAAATLAEHAGSLRRRPDGTLLWEGELGADALADLLRRALLEGTLLCRTAEADLSVRLLGCHYDALAGRVVAELDAARSEPA